MRPIATYVTPSWKMAARCPGFIASARRSSASARSCCPAARYAVPTFTCAPNDSGSRSRARSASATASANRPLRISDRSGRFGRFVRSAAQLGRALEFLLPLLPFPVRRASGSVPSVRCASGERLVELESLARGRLRLRHRLTRRERTAEQELKLGLRQRRVGFGEVRLPGDGLLEVRHGDAVTFISLQFLPAVMPFR